MPETAPKTVPLTVQLVAKTEFTPPADVPWSTDADGNRQDRPAKGSLTLKDKEAVTLETPGGGGWGAGV